MKSKSLIGLSLIAVLTLTAWGCTRDLDPLGPASFPTEAVIFDGEFGPGIQFQAFGNSKVDALDLDRVERFRDLPTLRFTVPSPDDPSGNYAGGAFVSEGARDLTEYDAVTFWAKGSAAATIELVGMGNDNTGTSRFPAVGHPFQISTTWTKYTFPIPLAEKLGQEAGLFQYADGADDGVGYQVWFADMRYEKTGVIANPRPLIETKTVSGEVGQVIPISGTTIIFDVNGVDQVVDASAAYLAFTSSDEGVATVNDDGEILVVGNGTAEITASLGDTPASGVITVSTAPSPAGPAPTPDYDAEKVISLFSDPYTDVTVDTWSAEWDDADVEDVQIDGNNTKKYSNLVFAGIEFTSQPIDATEMTYFRTDVWVQDPTSFTVKLVDFGTDGEFGGGDDSESEILLTPTSDPPMQGGAWTVLEIPFSRFAGLQGRSSLAQMIITSSSSTVYLDNVLFYDGGEPPPPPAPEEAAPTPTEDAANVISLFSNAYDDVTVDTWSAEWDSADLEDIQIQGVDTKKYSNLVFAGIEFTSAPVDATAMTHFHMNAWTPDATDLPAIFKIKLVDFGADGAFGGGDDSEHEVTLTAETTPGLGTGTWMKLEIPFAEMTGLTGRSSLAQMIISGDPNTMFVDNVYFRAASGGGSGVIDFEPEGIGATWTWNVFENVDNPALEIVANPDATGANTSATVAKFTARQAGQPWAGTQTLDKETFTLDASNAIVKIMVYKSVISDVGIKFEQGAASTGEIKVANTVINQWEELTFDFSGVIGPINTDITGLVVFPDFNAERASDNVVYFDNISFGPVGGAPGPGGE